MSACLDEVALWMRSNRLQLNTSKTEVLWYARSRRQDQIPTDPIRVGGDLISPATSVRHLGIYLDSDASMRTHRRPCRAAFAALRQIRSIRQCVSRQVMQSVVVSLVLQRLDFGNVTLVGLPAHQLSRLQSVLNVAARLVLSRSKYGIAEFAGLENDGRSRRGGFASDEQLELLSSETQVYFDATFKVVYQPSSTSCSPCLQHSQTQSFRCYMR